jgi:hypothetical protein
MGNTIEKLEIDEALRDRVYEEVKRTREESFSTLVSRALHQYLAAQSYVRAVAAERRASITHEKPVTDVVAGAKSSLPLSVIDPAIIARRAEMLRAIDPVLAAGRSDVTSDESIAQAVAVLDVPTEEIRAIAATISRVVALVPVLRGER